MTKKTNRSHKSRRPRSRAMSRTDSLYDDRIQESHTSFPEAKYLAPTIIAPFASIPNASAYVNIGACTQGTGFSQRTGGLITWKGVEAELTIQGGQVNGVSDDKFNTVRVVIATINPGTEGNMTWGVNSVIDLRSYVGLQRILYDTTMVLESPGRDSTGYMPAVKRLRIRLPLHQRAVWSASGSTTECTTRLMLLMVSDSSVVPNPGLVNGWVRVRFDDQ